MLQQVPFAIIEQISSALNVKVTGFSFASGGCINSGGHLTTTKGTFFLKWNDARKYPNMFEAESKGLKILAESATLRIPNVIQTGVAGTYQFLLLENIDQRKTANDFWKKLGEQLAALHRISSSAFGLSFNNYIGSLPQRNSMHQSWTSFFIEERLKPQVALASSSGALQAETIALFEKLYQKLPSVVAEETPALLHGDLWSGNLIADEVGNPCLIVPAVYFGNREAELAFTQL
ncbi:MAG TPA: fructosamine kinase family protein, partial [Sphingobacteriaceae bacterium]